MSDVLHGLHVVVTRPAHQAQYFQQLVETAGGKAVLFPVMAIAPIVDSTPALAKLMKLYAYDAVLFISTNAVDFGLALMTATQRQQLATLTLGAIGKKTANALRQQGLSAAWVPASGFTSEDFLAMPEVQNLSGKHILIIRGVGGREMLAEQLRQRGASVDYADVYQRMPASVSPSLLKQHHENRQLDIIAITSSEGLLNLLVLLEHPEWIKTIPLLVGSVRMAETARQAGFTGTLIIADDPGDEAMFKALVHWVQD